MKSNRTYTIKSGDTLSNIASKFNTTIRAIQDLNPSITNPDRIFANDKISIPNFSEFTQPSSYSKTPNFYTNFSFSSPLEISNNYVDLNKIINPQQPSSKEKEIFPIEFLHAIKSVENEALINKPDNFRIFSEESPEGGLKTIGYGHKFQPNEKNKIFTVGDANVQLEKDLLEARAEARKVYNFKYDWDALDENRKNMLTEKCFNVGQEGLKNFVLFMKALDENNFEEAIEQSKTSYLKNGKRYPLTRRHEIMSNYFKKAV
jgi:LysM repeat protein/GH24 family phage-related lysozyme (muramidase)